MSSDDAEERMQRAEAMLKERLANPAEDTDSLGALKAHLEPDKSATTFWVAIAVAVLGLLIVAFAGPIATAIQGFMAGNNSGDPPVIVYRLIGCAIFGVMVVFAIIHRYVPGTDFQVRHKGLRITTGSETVELRWKRIHDIVIRETEHIHPRSGLVFRDREITIQHDGDPIIIPGLQEHAWPITDILMQEWERVGAGHKYEQDPTGKEDEPKTQPNKELSSGLDLPATVAQKLSAGIPADKIMRWLEEKHHLPRSVAENVLTKALEKDSG